VKNILHDFLTNFSNFQDFERFKVYNENECISLSLKKINREIFKRFNEKYPNFFSKVLEMFYLLKFEDIDNTFKQKFCVCGKPIIFRNYTTGYQTYCSTKCAATSPETKLKKKQTKHKRYGDENYTNVAKIKQTKLEHYGDENYTNVAKIKQTKLEKYGDENYVNREKAKQTCLKKYGVDHYSKTEEGQIQIKKTKLEKYGDENYVNREKAKNTIFERYGVDHYSKTKEYQDKIKKTSMDKYGVESPFQNKEVQYKIKQTLLDKYGVDHYSKTDQRKQAVLNTFLQKYNSTCSFTSEQIQEKIKESMIEKYGVENPMLSDQIKQTIRDNNFIKYGFNSHTQINFTNYENYNEDFIREHFIKDGYFIFDDFCNYFNCSLTRAHITRKLFNIIEAKKAERNRTQNLIYDWLLSLNIYAMNNDYSVLNNLELDILIKDHNMAIEYDGLAYHSFGKNAWSVLNNYELESSKKFNHLYKTEQCEKQGIQLLHIFENEWLEKPDIWKSVIKSKLGLNQRIYARKCKIQEVDYDTSYKFLENNHLQGSCMSSTRIGLYYDNELVSLMTFGKSRYNKKYEYELIRFCSKQGLNIVGGASKLFKYFINNYKPLSVISYANRRWSDGNLYRHIGFSEIDKTLPNYFYFKLPELNLQSRIKFQKHKLENILSVYNKELTETENMYNNNYRKIYDCGNYVFEWIK